MQHPADRQHNQNSFLYLQNAKISRKTATAPADDTQDTCAQPHQQPMQMLAIPSRLHRKMSVLFTQSLDLEVRKGSCRPCIDPAAIHRKGKFLFSQFAQPLLATLAW